MWHIVSSHLDRGAIVHLSQLPIYFSSYHTVRACASGEIRNWFAHLYLGNPDTGDLYGLARVNFILPLDTGTLCPPVTWYFYVIACIWESTAQMFPF